MDRRQLLQQVAIAVVETGFGIVESGSDFIEFACVLINRICNLLPVRVKDICTCELLGQEVQLVLLGLPLCIELLYICVAGCVVCA